MLLLYGSPKETNTQLGLLPLCFYSFFMLFLLILYCGNVEELFSCLVHSSKNTTIHIQFSLIDDEFEGLSIQNVEKRVYLYSNRLQNMTISTIH